MKPELKYFQKFVIDLHLFTPVVRLAIFSLRPDHFDTGLLGYPNIVFGFQVQVCLKYLNIELPSFL